MKSKMGIQNRPQMLSRDLWHKPRWIGYVVCLWLPPISKKSAEVKMGSNLPKIRVDIKNASKTTELVFLSLFGSECVDPFCGFCWGFEDLTLAQTRPVLIEIKNKGWRRHDPDVHRWICFSADFVKPKQPWTGRWFFAKWQVVKKNTV